MLSVALDHMAAAVLILRPGEIVYANRAAAEMMGLTSAAEVMAMTPARIGEDWSVTREDGTPVDPDDYPAQRILAGLDTEAQSTVLRAVHLPSGREHWRVIRATPILAADGSVDMVVSITEDITTVKRAELTQRLLAQAGEALSSSLDVERTLREVARMAVPELADWCSVSMPDATGWIRNVAVAHSDPAKVEVAREYTARFTEHITGDGGAAEVLRGGPTQLHPEIPDELLAEAIDDPERLAVLRDLGLRAAIIAPIVAPGGARLGLLSLVSAESGRTFDEEAVALAEELGRRAGVAIENARLYTERAEIAATLQAGLMPDDLPDVPGFALARVFRPAGRDMLVGGDFYDVFETHAGWMTVVGDVAGQGAAAAALTAQARYTLRAAAMLTGDPAAAVTHLDEVLSPGEHPALCTVCVVLIDEPLDGTMRAQIVCAGHPRPVLVRDGTTREVGAWGPIVGAWPASHVAVEQTLEPGDVLVLYTDGVLDARRGDERFGEARLHHALMGARHADQAVALVADALDVFQRGPQADDTAIVAIERLRVGAHDGVGAGIAAGGLGAVGAPAGSPSRRYAG